jgi:hypothetical protein
MNWAWDIAGVCLVGCTLQLGVTLARILARLDASKGDTKSPPSMYYEMK